MAIIIHSTSPETPEQAASPHPSSSRTKVLRWAAVLAAGAAAAFFAGATLGADTRDDSGPAEDRAGSPQACHWTSEANEPVFPAPGIGGPPTPESILIFESCGGRLTGALAWLNPDPHATTAPPAAGSSDSGLVNPWAAGNAAVERYLCQLSPECDAASRDPGEPSTTQTPTPP